MNQKFDVLFLEQAIKFIESLDDKTRTKLFYNIDKAKLIQNPKLFKKLNGTIWEFRVFYKGNQVRLFAFWDKTKPINTLVIGTHGIIKKVSKVPKSEIEKAEKIRKTYFNLKENEN